MVVQLHPNRIEKAKCEGSAAYFIHMYCKVKNDKGRQIPFHMWPDQLGALKTITDTTPDGNRVNRLVAILKARQTGFTTMIVGVCVHLALFSPGSVILLFSKSHREAKELLVRIKTCIRHLPQWMQPARFVRDTTVEAKLSNGSEFISFGSEASGGDSYTANLVVIDEADLIRNLDTLLSGAKPTIDGGGQLVMLSRTDKANQKSSFKNVCREAFAGKSKYVPIFIPWWAKPGRSRKWYEEVAAEIESRTFSRDELYANYPANPEQALSARELDKRFPLKWLEAVFEEEQPLPSSAYGHTKFAGWKNLEVYRLPVPGRKYIVGIDVAGGNPNSDDSVAIVIDVETLEEVCVLCGKIEPTVHAHRAADLATWYHNAEMLPEKNHSHGTKLMEALKSLKCRILFGHDKKPGWFTDLIRKNLEYDTVAESVRNGACTIHSKATLDQLASLDVAELAAPFGQHDDRAMAFGLAVQGASRRLKKAEIQIVTGEPSAAAPREPTKHHGIRWVPTYATWVPSVEIDGTRVDVGAYDEEAEAAAAVNAACRLVGQPIPNVIELTPARETEIAEAVAEKLRDKNICLR